MTHARLKRPYDRNIVRMATGTEIQKQLEEHTMMVKQEIDEINDLLRGDTDDDLPPDPKGDWL